MEITVLHFDGCPNWQTAHDRVTAVAEELGLRVTLQAVASAEEAERLDFRGSPTILVDGRDVFARGDEPVGLSCRIYQTPDGPAGAPTVEQLREALG